tara:strand:+ start:7783 stop:9099 length:1317 start_codon:yes stop_codon:yes gene_type:complete
MKKITRRSFISGAAVVGGAAAIGAPGLFLPNTAIASPWIKRNGKIKVGVLFSQTGSLAVVENDSMQAVLYAIDEINRNGGVAGMEVEPVLVDARSDIKVYSEKISQLILSDRVVSTFGGYTSASRRAVAPTVMSRDHLFYYPTCYSGRECTQNIICTGPISNQHSQDIIPFMVEKFGPKVYMIGSNYIWPKESNKVAKVWLEQAGGEVVGEEYVPLGGSEFTPIFNKVRQQKPDWIFSTVVGDSDIALHKQFIQEGFKSDTMPIASLTTGEIEVRAMGAEAGAGHFLAAPYFQSMENETNQRFVDGYLSSKYGGGGVTHYNMEETYLSVYFWKAGIEKALAQAGHIEEVTPRMIREVSGGLELGDDISPEGKVWIDPDNFNMWLKPKIAQCQSNGQFKVIKEAESQVKPDPFIIYPERGVCYADGLHTPEGQIEKNVL